MNQTYERLFEELAFLMSDHQIQQNLDQNIKKRAEKIIFDGGETNRKWTLGVWLGSFCQEMFGRYESSLRKNSAESESW